MAKDNFDPIRWPLDLFTSDNPATRRIRIDPAQTSFFEGREFRTFKEWSVPTTATYVIRIVAPVNTILFELGGQLTAGSIRIAPVAGGTPGGTFAETLPIFAASTLTTMPQPPYSPQLVITAGGTLTGGTELDVTLGKVSANVNFASSISGISGAERGSAPGTYYYRITLTDATGVLKARWEERP